MDGVDAAVNGGVVTWVVDSMDSVDSEDVVNALLDPPPPPPPPIPPPGQ